MKIFNLIIMAGLTAGLVSCQSKVEKNDLKTQKDKVSYIIGVDIGKNLRKNSIDVDTKLLAEGIVAGLLSDSASVLSDSEITAVMTQFQQDMMAKQQEEMGEKAEKFKAEGRAFLTENAKKEGVKTLPSGLQYKVLTSGKGKTPTATSNVTTHYKGTLLDGTEFDNSYKRGEPATFPVNGVIKGWTEALQLMKEGDKWILWIPSDLAYGDQGAGGTIPPGATLVFEVELLKVE